MPTESVLSSYLRGTLQQGLPAGSASRKATELRAARRSSASHRYAAGIAGLHHGSIVAERRRITPVNGRALEILGHAIEYLADEYALSALQMGTLDSDDPRVEAVQLLILLNREVYFSNPEYEPLRRRLARWLFGPQDLPKAEQPIHLDPGI